MLSWGNFSHYTEVLFRSHFLLLLIKIFYARRRRAEVQIPCRYKVQKSATSRRQGGKLSSCFLPPSHHALDIVADNWWLFLGGRQRLRPEDCGLRLWLGDFKWSRSSAQQPMSGRARPEHEPSTTAQPIALHNAKVVCRWVAAAAAVVPECGPTRPGQMISAEIRDKTHAPRIALWRLRRFCLCFGFCLCLPCSPLPLPFFFLSNFSTVGQ